MTDRTFTKNAKLYGLTEDEYAVLRITARKNLDARLAARKGNSKRKPTKRRGQCYTPSKS